MTKYRATRDLPPHIKKGDIVEAKKPLVPEFKEALEPLNAANTEDTEKTVITNPDRDALKARATELGINFASNIPTDRLMELIKDAEAKAADNEADDEGEGEDGDGEGSDDEDGEGEE